MKSSQENILNQLILSIQTKIFSNIYKVGEYLPSERNLALEYDCSKTMIHDALLKLVDQGFLNRYPRKGYVVSNYTLNGNVDVLSAYLNYNSNHLDGTMFDALIEAILAIEGSALVKLSTNANEEDILYFKSLVKQMNKVDENNIDKISEIFAKFHHSITYLSGNALFPLLFNSFNDLLNVFYLSFIEEYGKENCLKAMKYFVQYIEKKQGQKAYNLLGNLLKQFRIAYRKNRIGKNR